MDLFEATKTVAPLAQKPTGEQLAKQGMLRSTTHADAESPGWSSFAFDALLRYAETHQFFTIEQLKDWAYFNGLPVPPAPGAWGGIARRGIKEKIIIFDSYRESRNPSQHMKPVRVWRSSVAWQANG